MKGDVHCLVAWRRPNRGFGGEKEGSTPGAPSTRTRKWFKSPTLQSKPARKDYLKDDGRHLGKTNGAANINGHLEKLVLPFG